MSLIDDLKAKAAKFNVDGIFEDFFGIEKEEAPTEAERDDVLNDLLALTTDEDAETVTLRALKVYRAAVLHIKTGGTVKFEGPSGSKTLKVRLK